MTVTYRDADPADAAALGGLTRATFIETFGPLYQLADLTAFLEARSDDATAAELADPGVTVRMALAGSVPVGFCKLSPCKLPIDDEGRHVLELKQLYVFRPWHGAGIAAVLTDWAIATARAQGAQDLWLSVFSENPRARRFYARHGFVEIKPWAFMVGSQADKDILCRKRLDD
jgi:diamine N-acetyltransferase